MLHELVILGAGPAGYSSAIYASRAMLNPVLITGDITGGQLTLTETIENFPGYFPETSAARLMETMHTQAQAFGTQIVQKQATKVDLGSRPFKVETDDRSVFYAKSLIIATGAEARWLPLPSIEVYRGYGVSSCAICDGFLYKDSEVIVVGGGNSAVEEGLYLAKIARNVTILCRKPHLKAEKMLIERLKSCPNLTVRLSTVITEVCGTLLPNKTVTHVLVENLESNVCSTIPCEGVFMAIGHRPRTDLFRSTLKLDASGFIKTAQGNTSTSVLGVFAAGDVADPSYRQAITAAGQGCMAALDAMRYLEATEALPSH